MASTTKTPNDPEATQKSGTKKHKPEPIVEALREYLNRNATSNSSEDEADKLQVVKLSKDATTPTRGSAKAAGYDLYSAKGSKIPARGKGLVDTDIQVKVPKGTYGRVAPRSGLAWKNHIDIGAGVVDEDYRGNLKVVMFNHADTPFTVEKGERIAQLVCQKICYPTIQVLDTLDETERGGAGFGSTGAK